MASNDNDLKQDENTQSVDKNAWLTPDLITAKWKKAFGDNAHVVLPVIHVQNPTKRLLSDISACIDRNISLIIKHKFNGCFLINHGFMPDLLVPIIISVKKKYPKLWIGANFLGCDVPFDFMHKHNLLDILDGLWVDDGQIAYGWKENADKIKSIGAAERLEKYRKYKWNGLYFGGVDFKVIFHFLLTWITRIFT